jgi:acetylglutamate kinase
MIVGGERVSLGRVGVPAGPAGTSDGDLAMHLIETGYVPVVASIGADRSGALLNVNADTFAAALAIALGAERLVIAGTTPGVLDRSGTTIPEMTTRDAEACIADGSATTGMIAKLRACMHAVEHGVRSVVVADGRKLAEALGGRTTGATVIGPACAEIQGSRQETW